MTQETKTLELALQKLSNQKKDFKTSKELLYQAVFLSTIEAASQVIGPKVAPTPLYRISHENGTLKFDFLEGKGRVPNANSTDIDYADLVYASFQCDKVALLSEGTTGTGKTYTLEQLLKTIYAPQNIRGLRLNASMSNVLQPYIEGKIDPNEGVLRININKKAVREIAALFIDEQNRGDTNAILGLLDNQVVLPTGERADIGLAIPTISEVNGTLKITYNEDDKVKPVAVHSAQNPPDAQYTGARKTDGAVGNRQVRINFPNMALNSGAATLNMTGRSNHHHEQFMETFTKKLANYLNLNEKELAKLLLPQTNTAEEKTRANQEYLALHAFSFDPANSQNKFLRSAVEGADHIIMLTGGNSLEENFNDELQTAKDWTDQLKQYGVNFQYNAKIDPKSELMLRIDGVRAAFNEQLIERDKTKATKIADALALITRYKQAYKAAKENSTSALEEFRKLQTPLTLADIASSYAIVLNDKVQTKNGITPVVVINQAFTDYTSLLSAFSTKVYPKNTFALDIHDPGQSIRYVCSYMAVKAVSQDKNGTADQYAKKMIDALNKTAFTLRTLDDGSDTKKLLAARINADIASFAGFIHEYKRDIADALNNVAPSDQVLPRYTALSQIVQKARNEVKTNYTLPRVERIFGI